ncbi:3'-5' exonuclease [Nocardia wallacei]|uniref:3'-5' exonuclease n=1 Tax=Nocardia wallacei TaxID=480035 RepID=UPI002458DEFF|nr:3'-5' exonuclease [Nocardia wallacei]
MATVVMESNPKAPTLDGSLKRKVFDFIRKVQIDDTAPGLHIEPIKGSTDPRVRTGRVDLNFRAVMFRVDSNSYGPIYIYTGTWPHDEAIAIAERTTLRVNPINAVLETVHATGSEQRDVPGPTGSRTESGGQAVLPFLVRVGFTLTDLTDRLGLDSDLARRALTAADDYAINEIAADAGGWKGSALLELAVGVGIDDIRDKLGFTGKPIDESLDDGEQVLAALAHPASKMQFTIVDDSAELRRIIAGGDFAAWRTFLHPEQRAYAERDFHGAFRLSGGAGTGKTVVAIHRARNLAKRNPNARIILTTFNKTLALELQANLRALDPQVSIARKPGDPGVFVTGIDRLAIAILDGATELALPSRAVFGTALRPKTSRRTDTDMLWREVVRTVRSGLEQRLATPTFLEHEYVAVVLANRITTAEQYADADRSGRGVRLSRSQRDAVWTLVEEFRRRSHSDGSLSFPELLALASAYLKLSASIGDPRPADHVIVDEAQDLHAAHWSFLRALVAEGVNDLFIAEDSHQRIYGQPIVLSRFGIKVVGRSRRLTLNYRTTAQNLRFAVGILAGAEYRDLEAGEESTLGYRSALFGPNPSLIECSSAADELTKVAEQVRVWVKEGVDPGTIAILTRQVNDRDRFVQVLRRFRVPAQVVDRQPAGVGHVQVLTMHRSKGMEFSRVILAGVDDAHVPAMPAIGSFPEEEQKDALLRERSLLYVAASRARDQVVVTWTGRRSRLLGR